MRSNKMTINGKPSTKRAIWEWIMKNLPELAAEMKANPIKIRSIRVRG